MTEPRTAYIFLEASVVCLVYAFCRNAFDWKGLLERPTVFVTWGLFFLWFMIDQAAIHLRLWSFPHQGTLGLCFINLPIEEYVLFLLHTVICYMLVEVFHND
jgi:lycopene cyclase domain-containing protein